jgi:membrane fusion protein (multidrug efflux system)
VPDLRADRVCGSQGEGEERCCRGRALTRIETRWQRTLNIKSFATKFDDCATNSSDCVMSKKNCAAVAHTIDSNKPGAAKEQDGGESKDGNQGRQKEQQQQEHGKNEKKEEEEKKPPLKVRVRNYLQTHRKAVTIGAVGFVVAVILGALLLMYLSSYESTDDAQVDGHLNAISARISGTVVAVYVENNRYVEAGQLLVQLDPRDYQVAADRAEAALVQAEAQLRATSPSVPIVQTSNETSISTAAENVAAAQAAVVAAQRDYDAKLADVRQAEANNIKAQKDVQRYQPLVERQEISHQQFDAVLAAARSQEAMVEAANASASAAQKSIDQSRAQLAQAQSRLAEASHNAPRSTAIRKAQLASQQAAMLSAKAQLDEANLNLSYTNIYAPVSGIVDEKTVELGQRIQPGEQMLVISQIDDIWITANFKETQLKKMHAGQKVDVSVDAYGNKLHGYVESMPGATGSVMSLLPPENATGNYVKVVQRLPVRIRLYPGQDPQHRLRIGMSVEPKVWLR